MNSLILILLHVQLKSMHILTKSLPPIHPNHPLCSGLPPYYAQSYAGITGSSLVAWPFTRDKSVLLLFSPIFKPGAGQHAPDFLTLFLRGHVCVYVRVRACVCVCSYPYIEISK